MTSKMSFELRSASVAEASKCTFSSVHINTGSLLSRVAAFVLLVPG
jgi:hypothetical protein